MHSRPITFITAICSALALVVGASAGCGEKKGDESPAGLCKTVYEERVAGPIIPFKEEGPKNKVAFLAYCEKLPVEYLKCEAKDLMKMSEKEMATCRGLIEKHQKGLNMVLTTGKPTREETGDSGKAEKPKPANEIPADLPTKAGRGDDVCSAVCGKAVDVEYGMAKVILKKSPAKLKTEIAEQVKKEGECNRRCNNHLEAGGAHKKMVDKINADCAALEDFGYAECIGKVNVEWGSKHKQGNNAIQWGYDEPCNGKWNGCDEGE